MKKILFVFGAGASRAISPKVPLLNNFFEKCLPFLRRPDIHPQIWLAFAILEEGRCFQEPNRELENSAAHIWAFHQVLIETERQPNLKSTLAHVWLREMHRRSVRHYLNVCIETASRREANLEEVFLRAEQEDQTQAHPVYDRYRFRPKVAIHYLLVKLQNNFPKALPHAVLARYVKEFLERRNNTISVSFLSFNYDVWLERELQREGIWHPTSGYGVDFKEFLELPLAQELDARDRRMRESISGVMATALFSKPFRDRIESRVRVLKPHGSLNWYRHEKSKKDLLLLEGGEGSLVTGGDGIWYLRDLFSLDHAERTYEPLFIPPIPQKPYLFPENSSQIDQEFLEADTIVVIGWSMPETDFHWESKIRQNMSQRSRPIQNLLVCNMADRISSDRKNAERIRKVFSPAQPLKVFGHGFENSVGELCDFLERQYLGRSIAVTQPVVGSKQGR